MISPDRDTVYTFDLEGRPVSWYEHGRTYKRALDGRLWGRERVAGRRRHFELRQDEAVEHLATVLDVARSVPSCVPRSSIRSRLSSILDWTPERLLAERLRFEAAYRPVSILPPDQYLSIVLQATQGCTWNRCTFCSFYQARPFAASSEEAFREHCKRVGALIGRAVGLRKRIFLADGNALTLSTERLLSLIGIARAGFPGRSLYGFIDVVTGEKKRPRDWRALREAGLRRVYVGLESGDDELLSWLNKPGTAREAASLVTALGAAGLRVALILMVGVGGARFAGSHVRRSLELLAGLPLDPDDVVYLSPFVVQAGSEYARRAAAERVRALDENEIDAQYVALRTGIRGFHSAVRVTRYDLREFVY